MSPPYEAVMECVPDARLPVKEALPEDRVPVPSVVVPSRNVTVPVGVPVPEPGATVALNVIV